jgi:hypothetical protein
MMDQRLTMEGAADGSEGARGRAAAGVGVLSMLKEGDRSGRETTTVGGDDDDDDGANGGG